jgi:hypothetical protein
MYPAYQTWWYQAFKLTEVLQGHHFCVLIGCMDPPVVAHSFDVNDVVDHDFLQTVLSLYKYEFRQSVAPRSHHVLLGFVHSL